MTTFEDWLRWLKSAQKGPVPLYASRGRAFIAPIAIDGEWPGSTMRGEIRLGPDASGTPLETFTVSAASIDDGFTHFTLSLSSTEVDALPAAPAGDGEVQFAFDVLWTTSGGTEDLLFGGIFSVGGRITE